MTNLVGLIKKAAMEAVAAEKPMNIRQGVVICCNPFSIRLSSKVVLTHEFLCVGSLYKERAKKGDRVLVISYPGGQKFAVIDKVVMV